MLSMPRIVGVDVIATQLTLNLNRHLSTGTSPERARLEDVYGLRGFFAAGEDEKDESKLTVIHPNLC